MKNYKTLAAIASSYGRVPKGAVVALSKAEAKRFARFLEVTDAKVTDEKFLGSTNADLEATSTLSGDAAASTGGDDDSNDDDSSDDDSDGLDEMSAADLKAKAAEMELPTSGSKAALIERIRLATESDETDSE